VSCPKCGLRQWNYDETTLTCKNGHQIPVGKKPSPSVPAGLIAATVVVSAIGTLLLDLFVRTIT
jgi:hypothetical protein